MHTSGWTMLNSISMHKLIQINHAVQELWALWNDAHQTLVHQKRLLHMPVFRWCWHVFVCKIHHVVQDLRACLLIDHGWTDGRTHIMIIVQTQGSCTIIVQTQRSCKTNIVIIVQIQGSYNIVPPVVVQFSHSGDGADPWVVKYSADPEVVQF